MGTPPLYKFLDPSYIYSTETICPEFLLALENVNGTPLDSELFTLIQTSSVLKINSEDTKKAGEYDLRLKVSYVGLESHYT